ncbi:MAG: AAA domain-containing protein, partial [Acidimicrobiia bacterium]
MATTPETILKYLADLAPEPRRSTDVVRRTTEFVYLGWQPYLLQPGQPPGAFPLGSGMPRKDLRRLAALDALHSTEQLLRLGWLFVTGTIVIDGKQVRFCKPLLSVPVRVRVTGFEVRIQQVGDIEMPADLFDESARDELEESEDPFGGGADEPSEEILHRMPKLQRWVATALTRAQLPVAPIRTPTHNPLDLRSEAGLAVVAGAAVYTARDTSSPGLAGTLLGWASQELSGTALNALYGGDNADTVEADSSEIRTPLPLNARQREALQRARNERITAVSGPPGTGKSHLVAALAIDEVSRGNSVLVATQSDYAAEVITDLLDRHPGPRYVRFGRREDRESAAKELADGMAVPLSNDAVRQLEEDTAATARELNRTRNIVGRLLEREAAFSNALRQRDLLSVATAQAPKVLEPEVDLDAASRLLAKASSTSGLFVAWRRTRSNRKLRRLIGARNDASLRDLEMAIDGGRAEVAIRTG